MSQATLRNELLDQACAFRRLLDLQEVTRPGHEVVVIAVLGPELVIGLRRRRCAFRIGIGADQLHRSAELGGARPEIERERLGIDRRLVLRRARADGALGPAQEP